ncbi:hypothetical protein Tco_0243540 [Tanacetum coccineum]
MSHRSSSHVDNSANSESELEASSSELPTLSVSMGLGIDSTGTRISSISIGSSNEQSSESPYLPVLFIGTSQSRQHDKSESNPLRDLEWLGRVVQRITGSMILVFNVSNQPCDSDSICSDPVSA